MTKRKWMLLLAACLILSIATGCAGRTSSGPEKLTIAYQSGVSYAPLIVAKERGLIEKHFDGEIEISWNEMNSGAAINEGLVSGAIDVGAMGVPVALAGIQAGGPIKFCFALSAQPFALMTNTDRIIHMSDITAGDQIALPNVNSVQHILLAMAAKAELGDAHALDGNLVALNNPDGYAAMVSGAVTCHLALSPYNFMEQVNENIAMHEVEIEQEVWPIGNTIISAVATETLVNDRPEVYQALLSAVEEAMEFINENPAEAAEIVSGGYDASAEEILTWINDERSVYSMDLQGVMDFANFMVEEGFLEKRPESFADLAYDNVKGN